MPPFRHLCTSTQLTATYGGQHRRLFARHGALRRERSRRELVRPRSDPADRLRLAGLAPGPVPGHCAQPTAGRRARAGRTAARGVGQHRRHGSRRARHRTGQCRAGDHQPNRSRLSRPPRISRSGPRRGHSTAARSRFGTCGNSAGSRRCSARRPRQSARPFRKCRRRPARMVTMRPGSHRRPSSAPSKLACWDLRSLRELRSQPLGRDIAVSSLAYDPAGTHLVTAGGESLQLRVVQDVCATQARPKIATAGSDTGVRSRRVPRFPDRGRCR